MIILTVLILYIDPVTMAMGLISQSLNLVDTPAVPLCHNFYFV